MVAARFFYDFGSPYAYLTAERIEELLGEVEWSPVFLVGVFKATGRRSWVYTERAGEEWDEISARLAARGLPPLQLVDGWAEKLVPSATPAKSTLMAQRVAVAASDHGALPAFTRELYRAEFQRAADITDPDAVVEAAVASGVPEEAARAAIDDPATKERVRVATDAAVALGVDGVPTIAVGRQLFWGDDRLEDAAASAVSGDAGSSREED